jgi:hypothetical protein
MSYHTVYGDFLLCIMDLIKLSNSKTADIFVIIMVKLLFYGAVSAWQIQVANDTVKV